MAAGDAEWIDRIRSIAESLLTLEVNTIEKENMSASKMPEMPFALHQIAELYRGSLRSRRFVITDALLALAQDRIEHGEDHSRLDALKAWTPATGEAESVLVTNGPKTFEALYWLSLAARHQLDESAVPSDAVAVDRTMFTRLVVNSQQLRQISLMLLQQHQALHDAHDLFDGTMEATTAALFRRPRPSLDVDTDILVQVRKIWDIGLERVTFQTALQVDGDVLVRVAPNMEATKRAFFAELHRSTVETALAQWHGLFALIGSLVSEVGRTLFGPRS
jgi:hypothetical protein